MSQVFGTAFVLNQKECGVACVNISPCFSFNLAAFYDINGRMLCELLSSDKYNNSDKFISSQSFHHFSIVVSALMSACLKEEHFHKFFIYSFLVKYCLPYSLLNRKTSKLFNSNVLCQYKWHEYNGIRFMIWEALFCSVDTDKEIQAQLQDSNWVG